jgi:uncharacterized protein (DUF1697 family)
METSRRLMADTRYAVLLRGINVGGRKKIAMADLRAVLERLGYGDVKTHLQSGNAVVSTPAKPGALARRVESQISSDLGLDVDVIVRTHRELSSVVKRNPYKPGLRDPAKFLVVFLADKPAAKLVTAIDLDSFMPDKLWVDGRELYLWCPNGVGKSKFPNDFFMKRLSTPATGRNWNTVTKLVELTSTST